MTKLRKTVLFCPLNTPGHINSSLGIADKFKEDHGYRTVFLILGSMIGTNVKDHGHELVQMEETKVYEDYEISDNEDPSEPVDEELKKRQGKLKKKFPGALKWPQIILRNRRFFSLDPTEAFIQSLDMMEKYQAGELMENNNKYAGTIELINPDLVIIDSYFVPPCILNLKNAPWVRLYSANPMPLTTSKLPGGVKPPAMMGFKLLDKEARNLLREQDLTKWQAMIDEWQVTMNRMIDAMSDILGPLQQFMHEHGCEPLKPGSQAHDSPHLNLYMFPKDIDYDQDDDIFGYPPRWFRCDSLIRKSISQVKTADAKFWTESLAQAMKDKSEMIYFSLGSLASGDVKLMKSFIDSFKGDYNRLYVVSKGVNGNKFDLNPGNMIGDNYIPQTFFLKRANLAIIHGGNNSVTECLYFGVPMIVLPIFADQIDNAQRIEDLGLGKRMNAYNWTQEEMDSAIEEVMSNKRIIAKCREIGERMRARDDSSEVLFILKKLMDENHLDQSFIDDCRNETNNMILF